MLHKMCLFYAYFNVLLICLQIYEYEYEYMKIESIWIELFFRPIDYVPLEND